MILVDPQTAERHAAAGIWGKATLDGLLTRAVARQPDSIALIDTGQRGDWRRPFPQALSWAELDSRVSATASVLLDAGLTQDDIVAIQLANTAETAIACLAALRAGLIPTMLPILWRRRELIAACRQVAPAALVTAARVGPTSHAEIHCTVAAEIASIRHVFAFGEAVPDGVQPLDDCLSAEAPMEGGKGLPRPGNAADHLAMISFAEGADAPRPLARSHNQWLSAAMMVVLAARIGPDARIVTPMLPTNLAGIASGLVAWLLAGCRLRLCAAEECDDVALVMSECEATHCVLPGRLAADLLHPGSGPESKIVRIWRDSVVHDWQGQDEGVDVLSLGEMALWASGDRDGGTVPLIQGTAASIAQPQSKLFAARMQGLVHRAGSAGVPGSLLRGLLFIGGPQLPASSFPVTDNYENDDAPDVDEFHPSGLTCRLVEARPPRARVLNRSEETFLRGGVAVPASELDRLYAGFPGASDAAAIALPNPVFGHVFHAAVVPDGNTCGSLADFHAYLRRLGVAPYMWPERIVPVAAIPRGVDGAVLRNLIEPGIAAA